MYNIYESGLQESATPTYTANEATTNLMNNNPNIVKEASEELKKRYTDNAKELRNKYINPAVNNTEGYDENVQSKITEEITRTNSARQSYLNSLSSGSTSSTDSE